MSRDRESFMKQRNEVLDRLSSKRRWYAINNKAGPVATIRIYDEIGFFGITAEDFVAELDEISASEVICAINCPGGDVFDGIAIYNALRTHPAKVTTRVDALAASAASVIVQAGEERVMLSSSQMMIHDAWGIAVGNAGDMRDFAELLDKQSDTLATIYAERSGKSVDDFRSLMAAETWMSDEEAVEQGLADKVVNPTKAQNLAPASAKKTLNDEIVEATEVLEKTLVSAQRVATHRAQYGDSLSQANTTGLEGLARTAEQVKAVLTPEPGSGQSPVEQPEPEGDVALKDLLAAFELESVRGS